MGTKLSVTTGARRLSLRPLAITAMLVAGFAITASGASAAKADGVWTVRPGRTLQLTNMNIEAAASAGAQSWDTDTAYIDVEGRLPVMLFTNAESLNGSAHLDAYSYTNPDLKTTHTVTLELDDSTPGHVCDSFSNGPNAYASTGGRIGLFAIHDGSEGCGPTATPLNAAQFFGNVQVAFTR